MTGDQRSELKQESEARFEEWARVLFMHGVLPMIVVGIGIDGVPMVCATAREPFVNRDITTKLLRSILTLMETDHVVERRVRFDP